MPLPVRTLGRVRHRPSQFIDPKPIETLWVESYGEGVPPEEMKAVLGTLMFLAQWFACEVDIPRSRLVLRAAFEQHGIKDTRRVFEFLARYNAGVANISRYKTMPYLEAMARELEAGTPIKPAMPIRGPLADPVQETLKRKPETKSKNGKES